MQQTSFFWSSVPPHLALLSTGFRLNFLGVAALVAASVVVATACAAGHAASDCTYSTSNIAASINFFFKAFEIPGPAAKPAVVAVHDLTQILI